MGTYIYEPLMGSLQKHGALAGLRRWTLERDDSGTTYPHRIYRDAKKNIYHSVTHILKETAPQEQKDNGFDIKELMKGGNPFAPGE